MAQAKVCNPALIWPDGRGVRQGSAKPLTAVQICFRPPESAGQFRPRPQVKAKFIMNTLTITQLVLAIILIVIVLLQQQGAGLGGAFGGDGNVYRSRRGIERFLFLGTIIVGIAFFAVAIATVLVSNK